METAQMILTILIAALSLIITILTFARLKNNDSADIKTRLTKIETDILYIRESLNKEETWKNNIEKRLYNLEVKNNVKK